MALYLTPSQLRRSGLGKTKSINSQVWFTVRNIRHCSAFHEDWGKWSWVNSDSNGRYHSWGRQNSQHQTKHGKAVFSPILNKKQNKTEVSGFSAKGALLSELGLGARTIKRMWTRGKLSVKQKRGSLGGGATLSSSFCCCFFSSIFSSGSVLLCVHRDRADYLGRGAQVGHLDFHTAQELCFHRWKTCRGKLTSTKTILIRGGGGGGGGGRGGDGERERLYTYRYTHCHHQNDSCIKMGRAESHFNVSLIVRGKVTRPCLQTTTFEDKDQFKRNQTGALLLTTLKPYRLAKTAHTRVNMVLNVHRNRKAY